MRALGRALVCAAALAGGVALAKATPRAHLHAASLAHASAPLARSVSSHTPARALLRTPAPSVALDAPRAADVPEVGFGERFARGLTIRGATPNRLILFTFDDGPDRSTTPALLDRLDAAGVHAVFFLSGQRIRGDNKQQRDQQEIARETVRRGHIVASHTVDHLPLPTLDTSVIVEGIAANEQIFQDVFGKRPWLFRPPFGVHTNRTDALFQDRGYTLIFWNLGTGDYQVRTAEDVHVTWSRVFARRELENGEHGGVILLHDTHAWSVEAFTLIYDDLMARNCRALDAGEELYDIVDDPSLFFAPRGDAPPGTDAPPAVLSAELLRARQARLHDATQQRCSAIAAR
jgi:peptidoglycan/xylan/chitin deacetylase (PgdA/CDA1 family)